MEKIPTTDLEKATLLLREIRAKSTDVSDVVQKLCTQAEDGAFDTTKGISFLEMKYQLLLSYLINLTYLMLQKTRGQSISGDEAVDRLVEIRTVLEKIRPIDQKLKYQIDKVIRAATTGIGEADPLRLKARPENMESKMEQNSDSGSEEEGKGEEDNKSKVYRPPKLSAVPYEGDESRKTKLEKQKEEMKRRALSSDLMQELKEQYSDAPTELRETFDIHRLKEDKRSHQRERYEEENFTRLTLTKREKHSMKRMATMSSLGHLTNFDGLGGFGMEDGMGGPSKKRKTEKSGSKKKGKGKGKKTGFKKKRH